MAGDRYGGIRYIGSKARVVEAILDVIGPPTQDDSVFVDAFCGTGSVAVGAADLGWAIRLNDHLRSSAILAAARLLSSTDVSFTDFGGYVAAVDALNAAAPVRGFMWREYSPASLHHAGVARQYFTEVNASRIDGMRRTIHGWLTNGNLSPDEHALLLADLILATNRVANIAGTYGCFMKHWNPSALRPIEMVARPLRAQAVPHETHSVDAGDVPASAQDVVYFDPPYTKRQYAAYYHINETIAVGDEPLVSGVTGLRPWKDKASPYCYKTRALAALHTLLANSPASRTFLSYSSEGHVNLDDLRMTLDDVGEVAIHDLGTIGRYRPNQTASDRGSGVVEYLLELRKVPAGAILAR